MRLAKEVNAMNINSFIITGISKRGWTARFVSYCWNPDVEAIVPFAIDLLDIDASLEHIYPVIRWWKWPVHILPYYQQGIDEKMRPRIYPAKAK